jgi:hypothetical protein
MRDVRSAVLAWVVLAMPACSGEASSGSTAVDGGGGRGGEHSHPLGPWFHAALVVDGTRVRDYVNGIEEVTVPLAFQPHVGGRTSIGVRVNKLYWYKGAIRLARFTPRVLDPAEFLPIP